MGFLFLGIVLLMIGADQAVKYTAELYLRGDGSLPLIKGVFQLTYCENTGAAWSLFRGSRWVFVVLTAAAVIALCVMLKKRMFKHFIGTAGALLIIGGALGNLIDRIFRGYVIDLFDFVLISFPVFNVADICITIGGVFWVVYFLFLDGKKDGNKNKI